MIPLPCTYGNGHYQLERYSSRTLPEPMPYPIWAGLVSAFEGARLTG
jgi:hypothetical protein